MRTMLVSLAALLLIPALGAAQQPAAPKVKMLSAPEDPRERTILVGRTEVSGMIIQFEIEPAKSMWMSSRNPPRLVEHQAQPDERYHVEVKPIDPASKTRIPFTRVDFAAVNRTTGKNVTFFLHPMWGSSGLHYASNSALLGDGIYSATVTVEMPVFARDASTKGIWLQPIAAVFHFKLQDGALVEVSESGAAP